MRWIVHIVTAIALLAGVCSTAQARASDQATPAQLTRTKSLPAAVDAARRDGAAPEVRLPAFALADRPALAEPPRVAAEGPVVVRAARGWARAARVAARGPPRG